MSNNNMMQPHHQQHHQAVVPNPVMSSPYPMMMSNVAPMQATPSFVAMTPQQMHTDPRAIRAAQHHVIEEKPKVSSTGVSSNRKKTRVACQPCVRAKSGCGEQRPCKRCVRLHQEDSCINRPVKPTRSRKRQRDLEATKPSIPKGHMTMMHHQAVMPPMQAQPAAAMTHQHMALQAVPIPLVSERMPFIPKPHPVGVPFAMSPKQGYKDNVPKVATVIGSGAWTRTGMSWDRPSTNQ